MHGQCWLTHLLLKFTIKNSFQLKLQKALPTTW
jgi:hypothetical protein